MPFHSAPFNPNDNLNGSMLTALVSEGFDPYGQLGKDYPSDPGAGIVAYFKNDWAARLCQRLNFVTPPREHGDPRWDTQSLDKDNESDLLRSANTKDLEEIFFLGAARETIGYILKGNPGVYLILALLNQGDCPTD